METILGTIAIKMNPIDLPSPDADMRYIIPNLVEDKLNRIVTDCGYDYEEDGTMIVFLNSSEPKEAVLQVIEILSDNLICGNRVLESAIIGIAKDDSNDFEVVHPKTNGDTFTVADW